MGQGRPWESGLKVGHHEERWQVLKMLLWPWLWCKDTPWLISKCDFITGVAKGPVNPSEGPGMIANIAVTAAGQAASLLNFCSLNLQNCRSGQEYFSGLFPPECCVTLKNLQGV